MADEKKPDEAKPKDAAPLEGLFGKEIAFVLNLAFISIGINMLADLTRKVGRELGNMAKLVNKPKVDPGMPTFLRGPGSGPKNPMSM